MAPGSHTDATDAKPLWDLMANKVRFVVNGHAHAMMRSNPIDGITELISGGGGHSHHPTNPDPRFPFVNSTDFGMLRLKLNAVGSNPDGGATLAHDFIATDDGATLDSGSGTCSPTASPPANPPPSDAVADAHVEEARPGTNLGSAAALWVDGGSDRDMDTYLRFSLGGLTQPVASAKLRMFLTNGSVDGPAVYGAPSSWTESSLNWSNRPGPSSGVIDDKGAVAGNAWVEFNVTPLVTGNGTYSFRVATNTTDGVIADSRETARKPQLVVTYGQPPPPANPPPSDAVADAHVEEARPGTNLGSAAALWVDGGSDRDMDTYLRFSLGGLTQPVASAKLRMFLTNGSVDGPAVYGAPSSWTESSLNWSNRPGPSSGVIDDKGAVAGNAWVEFNVTPLVTGNGTYSFRVATNTTDGVIADSRETARKPQLVVTYGQPPPPANPPPSDAVADAHVEEARPGTNLGSAAALWVDGGSDRDMDTYLRFSLGGLTQPVASAKLRMFLTNGSVDGPAVYGAPSSWTESSLNWSNRPGPSSGVIDDKGAVAGNAWVEFNVTPLVTGNGTYSFRVATNTTDGVIADSRETARKPQLVVTF